MMTLAEAARMIARKEVSPVELAQTILARMDRINERMRAFITVTAEEALDSARHAERKNTGGNGSPLNGVPLSVKDLYDTKGIRTTAGSKVFAERVPASDATTVASLKDAGAVLVGKTNLHEFAFGVTSINKHWGTPLNPWDPGRICGGSSGGSASAVALGLGFGSLGTDTGGSIRIPAALCGIVGLKPTYGRVSLRGVVPLSWSFDHAGPMAQTVEDAAILLETIAGHDPKDSSSRKLESHRYTAALTGDIKGLRAGIPKTYFFENVAPEIHTAVQTAIRRLEQLGAKTIDIDVPGISVHRAIWLQIASPEAYSFHERYLKDHADLYGADVRARIEPGRMLSSLDYVRAQRARTKLREEWREVFESVDVVVTPTTPVPASRMEDVLKAWGDTPEPVWISLARFTRLFNILGLPAISIPCGFTSNRLPIGMQIIGRAFDESTVLRAAHAYEQDSGWFRELSQIQQ